jgi:ADP-ribosylglycohydrolase
VNVTIVNEERAMGGMMGATLGNVYGAPLMHKELSEINEDAVD